MEHRADAPGAPLRPADDDEQACPGPAPSSGARGLMNEFPALLVNRLILAAAWQTFWAAILAQLLAIGLGIPLGLAQLSRNPVLRSLAWTYNWLFQGTPLLM